jgi:hypothetical protein
MAAPDVNIKHLTQDFFLLKTIAEEIEMDARAKETSRI